MQWVQQMGTMSHISVPEEQGDGLCFQEGTQSLRS